MAARVRDYLTIGEVVEKLSPAFPDLTISKVRFLEDEGLIAPERTPGGYRTFRSADVTRLELVLRLQRDHFMPLSVIREKLDDLDKGKLPPELKPTVDELQTASLPLDIPDAVPLTRLPEVLGIPAAFVRDLASFGVVEIESGPQGDEIPGRDIPITHTCWEMRQFGIEPRHLRVHESFAERQAALFQQILLPTMRHRTPEARQKLVETLNGLLERTDELTRHMLRRSVGRVFEDLD